MEIYHNLPLLVTSSRDGAIAKEAKKSNLLVDQETFVAIPIIK